MPRGTLSGPKPRPIFANMVFSIAGDLGRGISITRTQDYIRQWGGKFVKDFTSKEPGGLQITHLITSVAEFEKNTKTIKHAKTLGKACKVVTYDYLDDCLQYRTKSGTHRPRALPERKYLIKTILNERRRAIKEQRRKEDENRPPAEKWAGHKTHLLDLSVLPSDERQLYHLYRDSTGFEYKILLTRLNTYKPELNEKLTLYIFESHLSGPHLYKFGTKSQVGKKPVKYNVCFEAAGEFDKIFLVFKRFFETKTRLSWEDRHKMAVSTGIDDWHYVPSEMDKPSGRVMAEGEGLVMELQNAVQDTEVSTVKIMEIDDSGNSLETMSDDV